MSNIISHRSFLSRKEALNNLLNSWVVSVFLFLLYFMPQEYAIGETAFLIWQLAQMAELLFAGLIIIAFRHKITARWALFCLFYCSFYITSSLINGALSVMPSNIYECLRGVGFITVSEIYIQRDMKQYIGSFAIAGTIMCVAHIISEVLICSGVIASFEIEPGNPFRIEWMSYYLLTYDNESIYYFLPTILSILIYGLRYKRVVLIGGIAMLSISLVLALYHKALTAAIAYCVLVLLLLAIVAMYQMGVLSRIDRLTRSNYSIGLLIALIFSGLFVGLVISGSLGAIAEFFGKDANFSMRDGIWKKSFDSIVQHLAFGRGREGFDITKEIIGQTHCHNIILELLYTGGLITFLLYLLGIVFSFPKEIFRKGGDTTRITCAFVIIAFICAFFIVGNLDWYPAIPVQFLIIEMFSICDIETELNASSVQEAL